MNNENRNKYVIDSNEKSIELEKALSFIDHTLPNIVETERSKVFEIAYLCEKSDIDFWKDNSIFRNIVIYDFNSVVVDCISKLGERNVFERALPFCNNMFLKLKMDEYTMFNDYLKNYDIRENFYELSCTYLKMLYPSSEMKNMFLHMYGELYHIGSKLNTVETDDFNKSILFSIAYQKEKDVDVLKKKNSEELTEYEKMEIVETAIRNELQFLEVVDKVSYRKVRKEYERFSKIRSLKR